MQKNQKNHVNVMIVENLSTNLKASKFKLIQFIKKFKCELCDQKFSQFGNLLTHSKKIHNKIINRTSYECDTCKENFETPSKLKSHVTTTQEL